MSASHAVYVARTKVLEDLEDVASKLIEHHGSHERLDDDFDAGLLLWKTHRHLEYSMMRELDTEEVSRMFCDAYRVDYMIPIMKILTKALVQVQRDHRKLLSPIAVTLSKGIASLPNDLLSLIFEFANPPGEGTKQIIWLSHVSRRFRRVALDLCRLWTILHSDATKDELTTFIARSGTKTGLNVVISRPCAGKMDTNSFLDICVPLASRWSRLTLWSNSDEAEVPDMPETVDEAMVDIFHRYQLVLPRLQELQITQRRFDADSGMNSWIIEKFVPSWTTPNLRSISCEEYIPLSSSTYSALRSFSTSFSLATEEYPDRFEDLHAFLGSEKAITDLSLTIKTYIHHLQPLQLTETLCNSLTSFTLKLSPFLLPRGTDQLLRPLMRSLNMPNLSTFSACVELRYEDLLADPADSDELRNLVLALLPDHTEHPNLSSFSIELTHTEESKTFGDFRVMHKMLVIPLHKIPYVSTLSVKTFCELGFSRTGDSEIMLRELRLHDCSDYDTDFLMETIISLKKVNAWKKLDTFKLEKIFLQDDYKKLVQMVGARRLSFTPCNKILFWP